MRLSTSLVALGALASLLLAAPAHAQVKVAIVGFTGNLEGPALSALAVDIRGSMQRQVDPKALIVVSREEMGAIYNARGGPCRPDDVPCIHEASAMWGGRLFVRGVVRKTSEGIVVGATLESVRGILVAAAQTPLAQGKDVAVAVPILVRELLDGERAYRERMATQVRPLGDETAPVAPAPSPNAASTDGVARCKCLAIGQTYVAGELVVDDKGLSFAHADSAPTKLKWRYGWDKVGSVKATAHGANPAITMTAASGDELVVYFNLGNDRNACLGHIERHTAVTRAP